MTKILIVEDESIVAADLATKLGHLGYEVVGKTSRGEEAVVLVGERQPDIVLMDIHLAGSMDGITAAGIIRSTHDVPVIYLTAHSDPTTLGRAQVTEPFGYILKPFEERELLTNIEMARYRHRLVKQLRESREDLNHAQAVAHVGSWRLNIQRNALDWSDENHRIFDVPAGTEVSLEFSLSKVHPEDQAYVREQWSAAMHGAPYDIEHRIIVGDTFKWVRQRGEFYFDKNGALRGGFGTTQDITDKKNREEAVIRAKREWELTFDSVSDLIAILDDQQHIVRANRATALKLGLTPEELIGRPCFELMHKCSAQPDPCPHSKTLMTEKEHTTEMHVDKLGGDYLITTTPLKNDEEQLIGTVHVARDVTELRAAQRREQNAAVRLARGQSAIDTINVMREGVMMLNMDETILSVNPSVERMTGLTSAEMVGRRITDLMPLFLRESDLHVIRQRMEAMEQGRIASFPPLLMRRQDGKTFHVLPDVARMEGLETGEKVTVLTLKDITALREATQRLEINERKYRELVHNANSIIMRLKPDHTITFFNEYAQAFFGYKQEEVLGRNVLGTIVPEVDSEGRDLAEMLQNITKHPELHINNENETMRKDGRRAWVHWTNRAVRDAQGNLVELLCVGSDITRRREMQAQALRYRERLQELAERLTTSEEKDRWRISRYIHDTIIQNLSLSSIRLGTMAKPLSDSQMQDEVKMINQIRDLVNQAIDECRTVMSDLTPPLLYELGLYPALHDLAEKIQSQHETQITVECEGQEPDTSNPLRGLLFQSVRELVMNALKYAGPCTIHVTVSNADDQLNIQVADDGKGFDTAVAETKPNHQGGFGLFNIQRRLEGLGGHLKVDSEPGKGTTASIDIPLNAASDE